MNWPRALDKLRTVFPPVAGFLASGVAVWATRKGIPMTDTQAMTMIGVVGGALSKVIAAQGVNPNDAASPSMVRHDPIAPAPLNPLEIPDPFTPPLPPLPPRAPEVSTASERSPYAPYVPDPDLPKVGLDGLAQRPQEFRPAPVRVDPPAWEPLLSLTPEEPRAAVAVTEPADVIRAPRERRKRAPRVVVQEPGAPMPETATTGDDSQGFEP